MSLLIKALKQAERVNRDLPDVSELDDDSLQSLESETSVAVPDPRLDLDVSDGQDKPGTLEDQAQSIPGTEPEATRDPSPMSLEAIPSTITHDQAVPLPRHASAELPEPPAPAAAGGRPSVRSIGESVDPAGSRVHTMPATSTGIVTTKSRSKPLLWAAIALAACAFGVWYSLSAKVAELSMPVEPPVLPSIRLNQVPVLPQTTPASTESVYKQANDTSNELAQASASAAASPADNSRSSSRAAPAKLPVPQRTKKPGKSSSPASASRQTAVSAPALPKVRFNRTNATEPSKHDLLRNAYTALVSGNYQSAASEYKKVLERDRNSSDAWIGLAAIAAHRGDKVSAQENYRAALRINPNDGVAQAGLTSLIGHTNPVAQESQLRNLAANKNSGAAVQFALGNTLAAQGRWNEAQRAYFDASSADPTQPDYAFNLAVALERIRQPEAAVSYYKRAIAAANSRPAQFSIAQAKARISTIDQRTRALPAQQQPSTTRALSQ